MKYFYVLALLVYAQYCRGNNQFNDRLELEDILPEDQMCYDKLVPPVVYRNDSDTFDPAVVSQFYHILGIDSINEASMSYVADLFFTQSWRDDRLRYPADMPYNRSVLDMDWLNDIWRPDSYFRNAKTIGFQTVPVPNHFAFLRSDKTVYYSMRLTLELSCAMNFALYPHDTHECRIQVESMSYTVQEMVFEFKDRAVHLENDFMLPQLVLVEALHGDCSRTYSSGRYACLEIKFVLKRNMGYYLINTYIPTCLIVIVSWISFWIRPEALPARVTLGVTSLLTLLTQHGKSQESLPHVSYLKIVDAFMMASIIFVFLPLIEMCIVIIILHGFGSSAAYRKPVVQKVWKKKRNAVSSQMTSDEDKRSSRMHTADQQHYSSTQSLKSTSTDSASSINVNVDWRSISQRRDYALQLDRICRVLFPSMFILLNTIYWSWALVGR